MWCSVTVVDSDFRVVGSSGDKDFPLYHFWKGQKTNQSIDQSIDRQKLFGLNTDQNRSKQQKKLKSFDQFWQNKTDGNRRFLMFESHEILNMGSYLATSIPVTCVI